MKHEPSLYDPPVLHFSHFTMISPYFIIISSVNFSNEPRGPLPGPGIARRTPWCPLWGNSWCSWQLVSQRDDLLPLSRDVSASKDQFLVMTMTIDDHRYRSRFVLLLAKNSNLVELAVQKLGFYVHQSCLSVSSMWPSFLFASDQACLPLSVAVLPYD